MNEIIATVQVLAIDLAKHVFQVAGADASGTVVWEAKVPSREAFWTLVKALPPGLEVLLEVGGGAQGWARELQSRGQRVRVLPARRVAEHRSGAKNDRNDARALLRAGRDSAIHAVPIKSAQRLAQQAIHRVRAAYTRRRTSVSNQIRGLLLEQDVVMGKSNTALKRSVPRLLEEASLPLPPTLRELIAELFAEWEHLGERIEVLSGRLGDHLRGDEQAQRLMTIPGIGPITASALVCKELDPRRFAGARDFAASFGLVPDQHSSGGKVRLGKMSKRGDRYIRGLLIQGAQAVLARIKPNSSATEDDRLHRWVRRHGKKGAAVRVANRNLRIVWRLLHDETLYRNDYEKAMA